MNRRSFLKLLGLAGAGLVVPELVEPRRRIWQVSRAAPVAPLYTINIDWALSMRRHASLFARYVDGVDDLYPVITYNGRDEISAEKRRQIRELLDSMSSKHRPLTLEHENDGIIMLPASVDLKFVDFKMTPSLGRGYVTIEGIKT